MEDRDELRKQWQAKTRYKVPTAVLSLKEDLRLAGSSTGTAYTKFYGLTLVCRQIRMEFLPLHKENLIPFGYVLR